MKPVTAVCHTPSPNTRKLANTLAAGMKACCEGPGRVNVIAPEAADADTVLGASGIIIGTTENFGTMAGLTKDFFERIYYPCLEQTQGLPVAVYIRAGEDGRGSAAQLEKIITGLRWRLVQPVLTLRGPWTDSFGEQVENLGGTVAAGIEAGIF